MNAKVTPCYFATLPTNACEASDLAPEELVRVDKRKYVGFGRLHPAAPPELLVCSECADRGWDEILGYADGGE